ncbi:MAG: DUF4143 domain-containing protein [Candidatus Nomurabacteria bacterium]|jgi:predicted AAA+ superfamily ATPase|nr:DUF4143 domain-containing protein [Candidatus Nomurabacteria bacterium]
MEENYKPRIVEEEMVSQLKVMGGLLIQGARGVGKTTVAEHMTKSQFYVNKKGDNIRLAEISPEYILEGATPRLIDEWQLAPSLWNSVKRTIDERKLPGQFILAGSAAPTDDGTLHTGAGRIARLTMRTMTLAEKGLSEKKVRFADLFTSGAKIGGIGGPEFTTYISEVIRGGWPLLLNASEESAEVFLTNYINNIADVDMRNLASPPSPQRLLALIRSLARNVATDARLTTLAEDANIATDSVRKYLDQLSQIFLVEELPAWNTHLRSATLLRTSPKWYFLDPSIAANALGASRESLLGDLRTFGLLFESLVARDLRVLSEAIGARIYFYRDADGLEVDFIVEQKNEDFIAIEVKLGDEKSVENAVDNLEKLKGKLADSKLRHLKSTNVITAGTTSYTHPSGTNIIALGHLY